MKKRILSLALIATLGLSLVGCGTATEKKEDNKSEIALITDVGTIDDKSFNQGAWEGVKSYAEENNKTYKYYKPIEKSESACIDSIKLAIKAGAKVVVCPGFLFNVPVFKMQTEYPDVKFIFLDGVPNNGDFVPNIAPNTHSILFAEEQAGFLAGYAAVIDGYKNLGFMGGIAVPAVVRYGYGYIQGADYAAKELGLSKDDITIKYTYVGNFDASPENMSKASAWYNEGTDVIFACGGAVGNSVMKAAETAKKKVIGVDVDQSGESDTVITSSMKNLKKSVYDTIDSIYKDKFEGGVAVTLGADSGNVLLPMETSKFNKFSKEKYDEIYKKIISGDIKISKDDAAEDATGVPNKLVKIDLVK